MDQDSLTIELLETVDKYVKALEVLKTEYNDSFISLGRARYYNDGVKMVDLRNCDAIKVVEFNTQFELIDRRDVSTKGIKIAPNGMGKDVQKDIDTKEIEKDPENVLRRRGKAQDPNKGNVNTKEVGPEVVVKEAAPEVVIKGMSPQVEEKADPQLSEKIESKPSKLLKDPIYQFGGFVTPHLKQTQTQFSSSLQHSIHLLNLGLSIKKLLKQIEDSENTLIDHPQT